MNTQILALQEEYERMQTFIEGRPASTYELNKENYSQRLRELDAQIDAAIAADTPKTKAEIQAATYEATCTACNIADAMKVCDFCVFRQCRSVSDEDEKFIMLVAAASFEEPQTAEEAASAMLIGAPSLNDMTDAEQKKWYADIQPIEF